MQLEEVRCLIQSRALEQVDALEQLDESQRITQATSILNPEPYIHICRHVDIPTYIRHT